MQSNKMCCTKEYKRILRKAMRCEMALSSFIYSYLGMRPSETFRFFDDSVKKHYIKHPFASTLPNNN